MAYNKYPTKKRRYPFKRKLRRRLRRIAFMVVAAVIASGINYYNKNYYDSAPDNDIAYEEFNSLTPTDPKTLQKLKKARNNPNAKLWVTLQGQVIKLLKDDLSGSRHQKFLIKIDKNFTLLVSHNIDLAPRVPIKKGERVNVSGLYEWNNRGGVIHWTHHDPKGKKKGGWIKVNGKRYN